MELRVTPAFLKAYGRLTRREQAQVDQALQRLLRDPRYPSLQARRWDGNTWYGRASRDLRFFYEIQEGYYVVRHVGHHDIENRA